MQDDWYDYSGQVWRIVNQPPPIGSVTVHEAEHRPVVIYDANGQPLARPKQAIGFDLTKGRQ